MKCLRCDTSIHLSSLQRLQRNSALAQPLHTPCTTLYIVIWLHFAPQSRTYASHFALYILHTSHTTTPHHTANSTYYASHSTLQALWNLHPTLHTLQSEPYEQQFILDFRWLPPLHSTNHTPDAIQVIAWHNRLILTYFNQTGQGWRRMRRLTESGKVAKNQQRLKKGFPFCFGFASAGLSCRSAFGYLCSAMPHILNRFVFA